MNRIILILSFLYLASCQYPLVQPVVNSNFQPFTKSPWIEIQQKLIIEPDHATSYIQSGKVITQGDMDLYANSCEITIKNVSENHQFIYPGRYRIVQITSGQTPMAFLPEWKMQYASIGEDLELPDIQLFWKFRLQSDKNPEVLYLICSSNLDTPFNVYLPTIEEIRQTMGVLIVVNL